LTSDYLNQTGRSFTNYIRRIRHKLSTKEQNVEIELPVFKDRVNVFENCRNIYEGYQRGWGLQFGGLKEQVLQDPLYQESCNLIAGRSIVTEENRMNLFLIIKFFLPKLASKNIIEFGSYRGGSAIFMANCLQKLYPEAYLYALDSYEGMPVTDKKLDLHEQGDFSDVNLDEISGYAKSVGINNIRFVKGVFEDTLPEILQEGTQFGLAHVDCDIYSAVAYSQDKVYPQLCAGGYLVYDDACVSSCIGATQAVEEFMIQRKQHSEQIWPQFVFRKQV